MAITQANSRYYIKLAYKNPFKVGKNQSSKFVLNSLDTAHNLALKKEIAGIINCPIDKSLLRMGVTEYLASSVLLKNSEVMIIRNERMMVSPITTHIDIKSIHKKLNKILIIKKIKTINHWFKKDYKRKPKIGILGLNPHNAELRKDSEEFKIILPAIKKLRNLGILAKGPIVSDTTFINDYKNYDIMLECIMIRYYLL